MREFEVTLNAISRKTFKLRADSKEEAIMLAEAILENTDLLSFSDEDVSSMDMTCDEQCGGVCEICSRACENCGDCTELEQECGCPDRDCKRRCPACGSCMADIEDDWICFRQVSKYVRPPREN